MLFRDDKLRKLGIYLRLLNSTKQPFGHGSGGVAISREVTGLVRGVKVGSVDLLGARGAVVLWSLLTRVGVLLKEEITFHNTHTARRDGGCSSGDVQAEKKQN